MSAAESLNGRGRADSFRSARHFPLCLKFVLTQDWGVIGEKKSKNGKKQAFLWVFYPFSGNFRGIATDSDSVIRWFESSYPSQNGRNYQKMVISTVFISITGCKSVEFVQFVERVYPVWDCFWD